MCKYKKKSENALAIIQTNDAKFKLEAIDAFVQLWWNKYMDTSTETRVLIRHASKWRSLIKDVKDAGTHTRTRSLSLAPSNRDQGERCC